MKKGLLWRIFLVLLRGTKLIKESDVDIAILFDTSISRHNYLLKEGKLIGLFSKFYPKREINLVNLNESSPLLRQSAFLEGTPLYVRNKRDEIAFQLQTAREYEEYRHLSSIYNKFLKQEVKNL